jgi:excisionase family DNA binding protein
MITDPHRTGPDHRARGGGVPVQAYTVEQVAEILNIGRDKVYFLIRTGQLRSIKIGKLRRITDRHLAEFVTSLEEPSLEQTR